MFTPVLYCSNTKFSMKNHVKVSILMKNCLKNGLVVVRLSQLSGRALAAQARCPGFDSRQLVAFSHSSIFASKTSNLSLVQHCLSVHVSICIQFVCAEIYYLPNLCDHQNCLIWTTPAQLFISIALTMVQYVTFSVSVDYLQLGVSHKGESICICLQLVKIRSIFIMMQ